MINDFFANFHFLRPYILIILILPFYLYWKYYKKIQNNSSWQEVCDAKLLKFLLIKGSSSQRRNIAHMALIGIICGIIGSAGPSWNKREIPELTPENPLMILLNVSSDMQDNDLSPNRLDRAKYKIKDLLQTLQSVDVGLVVYSSEPFLISPITQDTKLIANLLSEITMDIMPVNGNRLDKAINYAVEKLWAGNYRSGRILIFTPDAGNEFQQALQSAKKAKQDGYTIYIDITSAKNSERLDLIAEQGGGKAELLSSNDRDIKIFTKDINVPKGAFKESNNNRTIWFDNGYYLTFICIICALYFFRRGILLSLVLIIYSPQVEAGFFQNSNQEGLRYFNDGNYSTAAIKFTDSKWQGASFYKNGDYDKAYQAFAKSNDIDSLYNQGNALAKGGKIAEAIKKYEEVLKSNPHHEDAKFNLEYLKRKQQDQKQSKQSGDKNQEDNQEQSSQADKQDSIEQNNSRSQENDEQDKNSSQNNREEQEAENKKNKGEQQAGEEIEQSSSPNQQNAPQSGELEQKEEEKEQQNSGSALQNNNQKPKYDEEAQAKAQQYREIPEDVGGLLKAFIRKEYQMRKAKQ